MSQEDFMGDVAYEAWRRGMNPDSAVDYVRDSDHYGQTAESCVDGYQDRLDTQRMRRQQEEEYREQDRILHEEAEAAERRYFDQLENPE